MKILGLNLSDNTIVLNNCCISIEIPYFLKVSDLQRELDEIKIPNNSSYEEEHRGSQGRTLVEIELKDIKTLTHEQSEKIGEIFSKYASKIEIFIARRKN